MISPLPNRPLGLLVATALLVALAAPAQAATVGKRISTVEQWLGEATIVPGQNYVLEAPVPTTYKSSKSFLKITTTFWTSCFYGSMGSSVEVDGMDIGGGGYGYEQVGNGYSEEPQVITKVYFLNPTADDLAPGALVKAKFNGLVENTTLCYVNGGRMVVEMVK